MKYHFTAILKYKVTKIVVKVIFLLFCLKWTSNTKKKMPNFSANLMQFILCLYVYYLTCNSNFSDQIGLSCQEMCN